MIYIVRTGGDKLPESEIGEENLAALGNVTADHHGASLPTGALSFQDAFCLFRADISSAPSRSSAKVYLFLGFVGVATVAPS
jgi:hypothetical protein